MLAVLGILAVTAMIIWFEVPSLWKRGLKRELIVFSILLILGAGVSIAKSSHIQVPNPLDMMNVMFKPLGDFIFGIIT
ncbi:hypothetical protein [Paenibacillus eucommiae]|uniref:Uncharacterized protein n=1 Tax=Paenibacillus eucommiae TaxID=1355755 RepID=A0ABS4J4Q4_9BACL|nr:hypothetical protein [Paenibacillus eucommiae]MBP1994821.1 hypothetical protein [Paenibacillus eucommiae]